MIKNLRKPKHTKDRKLLILRGGGETENKKLYKKETFNCSFLDGVV